MGWDQSEERQRQKASGGKYFKLQGDGDTARIVLLSEPQEVEKNGQNGPYVVFSIEIWNVEACRAQTWDMSSSPFKGLLGLKKAIGLVKLYNRELVVVRSGEAGSMQVSYTFTPDEPIQADTLEAMADAGCAPFEVAGAVKPASRKPAPTVAGLEGALRLATSLPELRVAFEAAWAEADGHEAVQSGLQVVYQTCKAALEKPAATAAAAKRAPAF
jgi:hypothetical protein